VKKNDPFQFDKEIYLDRFMIENRETYVKNRNMIKELKIKVKNLVFIKERKNLKIIIIIE
jgi:ubiquitin carboxyl-terminal hydrolase 25/28